ncbi:MAG: B12-binding domain-containing protein [Chitinispirillaceae bacterium]
MTYIDAASYTYVVESYDASFSRDTLLEHQAELAEAVINILWTRFPHYEELMGTAGKLKCRQDIEYHFMYLADAVGTESEKLFFSYIKWVKNLFSAIGVPHESFRQSLIAMREAIAGISSLEAERDINTGKNIFERPDTLLQKSIQAFEMLSDANNSFISLEAPLGQLARNYLDALLSRERDKAMRLVLDAVENGTDVREIYEHVFQITQWEIGRLWQENKVNVAQEHYCTAVTQLVMSRLYPYIFNHKKNGLVFVGTSVGDELHELGIRMITDFFELDGWDTYFLGANTPLESIIETAVQEKAHVVGISVTITYHISEAKRIIAAVRARPELAKTKVLVGGYPFNLEPGLWKKLGADGSATSAREAIQTARLLVTGRKSR